MPLVKAKLPQAAQARKPAARAAKVQPTLRKAPKKEAKPRDPMGFRAGLSQRDPGFRRPSARQMQELWRQWTPKERKVLERLDSPKAIQEYLDSLFYDPSDTLMSVREILRTGRAHCLGSSMLAHYALLRIGYESALVGFDAVNDEGHGICVFRQRGCGGMLFGAISKSNFTTLRGRDCVYASLRELVMSYFDFHFNLPRGEKTMTEWMGPFNAFEKEDPNTWLFSEEPLETFEDTFDESKSYPILMRQDECRRDGKKQDTGSKRGRRLMLASKQVIQATKLGGNPHGFKPIKHSNFK